MKGGEKDDEAYTSLCSICTVGIIHGRIRNIYKLGGSAPTGDPEEKRIRPHGSSVGEVGEP